MISMMKKTVWRFFGPKPHRMRLWQIFQLILLLATIAAAKASHAAVMAGAKVVEAGAPAAEVAAVVEDVIENAEASAALREAVAENSTLEEIEGLRQQEDSLLSFPMTRNVTPLLLKAAPEIPADPVVREAAMEKAAAGINPSHRFKIMMRAFQ